MNRALVPAKPPTALLVAPVALPAGRGAVDAAEIGADEAADDVVVAGAGDGRESGVVNDAAMVPRFTPAKPPR